MDNVIEFVKGLVRSEAARLVSWATMAAAGVAVYIGDKIGIEFSQEFLTGLGVFVGILATELIRHLVYSEKTYDEDVASAAETGETP